MRSHPPAAYDIIGDGWHREIAHDRQQQEYDIGAVRRTKAGLSSAVELGNIKLDHLLLDLRDERTE